jgi:hypothetical protein
MGVGKNKAQVIDVKAVAAFKSQFSDEAWTVYDIAPDYGIDQKIEIFEKKEKHTGKVAYIQIKGRQRLKGKVRKDYSKFQKAEYISQELEVEHLKYYEKRREPVFLFVIDVETSEGYWLFLQKHIKEQLLGGTWRSKAPNSKKKPKVTVRVPITNRMTDAASFRAAIEDAIAYMDRLSVIPGIASGQAYYRRLDRRFDPKITATEGGQNINLNPLENVHISIEFSKEFCETGRLDELIGRGFPVQIAPGEVDAEGSPLIREILDETAENRGQIHFAMKAEGHLKIVRIDAAGEEVGRPHEIDCTYEGGLKETRYVARLRNDILIFQGTHDAENQSSQKFDMSYCFGAWFDKPLLSLPYFDFAKDIFLNIKEGEILTADFFINDMPAFGGFIVFNQPELEMLKPASNFVALIEKARWISKTFGINPLLPRGMEIEQRREITRLYRLAQGEEIRLRRAIISMNFSLSKPDLGKLANVIDKAHELTHIATVSDRKQPFLGAEVDIGPVETQLTNALIEVERGSLTRYENNELDAISIAYNATENSEYIIKKASEEILLSWQAEAMRDGFME